MSNYEAGSAEWLAALDYPKHDRAEIQRNREMALKQGIVKKSQSIQHFPKTEKQLFKRLNVNLAHGLTWTPQQ